MILVGQLDSGRNELVAALWDHKTNAAFKERRKQLRAEKKRPIGEDTEYPDPDFFLDRKEAQHNGQWSW
jgi:uncharacterized protein involved in type VI secretion and phage assembly